MKKILLALLLSCLTFVSVRATVIWSEPFSYANGVITNVSSGAWVKFSGSGTDGLGDMFEYNNYLEVAATISGTSTSPLSRQDDDYRLLCTTPGCSYTNGAQPLYASFIVICTNLPNAAGTYFASFYSTASGYFGRIWAQTTGTVVSNTWRLGATANHTTPFIFPVDLATNVPYQVVVFWDASGTWNFDLWVNPISQSDTFAKATDQTTQPIAVNAFAFRQAGTFGSAFFKIQNLVTATTFSDASPTPTYTSPIILVQPQNTTNSTYTTMTLTSLATGQSLADLFYQWQKADSSSPGSFTNVPGANANVLSIVDAQLTDAAQYQMIVSNLTSGLSATSSPAWLVPQDIPGPPQICGQPAASTSAYYGQTVTLTVCVNGAPPASGTWGTWYYNGNLIGSVVGGQTVGTNDTVSSDGLTLTIANVEANNGTAGTYYCHLVGYYSAYSTNTANAVVVALPPVVTNIYYLRGLVDNNNLPTNTTTVFRVTGTVISKTNYSTAVNGEYVIQDATGGITVYNYGAGGLIPKLGDNVTVTGPLGQYQSMMEIEPDVANAGTGVITNYSTNLPPSKVLSCSFTNGVGYGGISNAFRLYEGTLLTFTNVHFPAADGTTMWAGNTTYAMVDAQGNAIPLYVYYGFANLLSMVIPTGTVWRVTGPMCFYLSTTAADRSSGYQFEPSMPEDFQINPATTTITLTLGNPTLTWPALPLTLYSVLRATNVNGPYTLLAGNLVFTGTTGQYTDANPTPATRYYKITSP
jgi:hypothetical protein